VFLTFVKRPGAASLFTHLSTLLIVAGAGAPSDGHGQQLRGASCRQPPLRLLGAQATFIGQDLRPFAAKYSGPLSLSDSGDRQVSQSYGLYGGACLNTTTSMFTAYLDLEMVRGSGISHASGVAAITNGDVLRQGSVDLGSGPYVARGFVRWTIPLPSAARDTIEASMDAFPAVVSTHRVEINAGKFAATDLFDLNRYANSTRTQFLDWVLFNNGAWDYAADTRGYSNGVVFAWITPQWILRAGSLQMPIFANGNRFDGDIARARGDNVELTIDAPRDAVLRFLAYVNQARMGRYSVATAEGLARGVTPDVVADDAPGRVKYGFAVNGEFPIADNDSTGVFGRIGWNDGRTESFAFTECDRHVSLGAQVAGDRWRRSGDVFGIAAVADGLSAPHRAYLAAGGKGFLLGDGALRYGPESALEAYYSFRFAHYFWLSPDVILISNPGYNRDRGPAVVFSARIGLRL
jgi:hypothetical protein